nr:hypothetical protein [Tanacetum cinerariifolium]
MTLADKAILSGADNRLPMLEKDIQTSLAAGTSRTYTQGAIGNNSGKQRTAVCYNCKGEGHMSKQCTKPKRKRDDSWTYTQGAIGNNSGKQRTAVCYNYKGEGHMSKQCTKPKRKRDDSWYKDKVLLVQAQANGQIVHEEELAFLADPGIVKAQAT